MKSVYVSTFNYKKQNFFYEKVIQFNMFQFEKLFIVQVVYTSTNYYLTKNKNRRKNQENFARYFNFTNNNSLGVFIKMIFIYMIYFK